jgi:methionyl-tRNA formyltransferase
VTAGRTRTVFVGSGAFGRPTLERLLDHPAVDLVGLVTAPPKPSGRQQRLSPTAIGTAAAELGIEPVQTPNRLRARESIDSVLRLRPELIVLADYGQLVPSELLELPYGSLNLHPSLLPRHRGATPVPATILAGDRETGVTLLRMDAGLDSGPIVAQRHVALAGDETTPELEARLADLGADLLAEDLEPWVRGEIAARPQPENGATMSRELRREDGRLDPRKSVIELDRQVRAYQPWPGSFIDTLAGRLVVWRSEPVDVRLEGEDAAPGRIGRFGLYAHDRTYLALREVQPEGGKRMGWEDFVRGRPAIVGSSIVG